LVNPQPTEALITAPKPGTEVVTFDLLESGSPHAEARSVLYLDARSGTVLGFRPYATGSLGNKVVTWGLAINKGEVGPVAQGLLFMGALGVPVLAYTGISSYLRRLSARRSTSSGRAIVGQSSSEVTAFARFASRTVFIQLESWRRFVRFRLALLRVPSVGFE
jgi:vanillate O-demethylase ferredoxin subunit